MSVVTVTHRDGIAWVRIDNPPVNATSTAVRTGLLEAVSEVAGARLAVLDCAGRTFIAGGDMSEFDAPPVEPHLPDVVQAIEESAVPFVALLHGTVLGGGLEVAMACAWRHARPGTRFGLPEVNVGLIPGAGGSQRAPRLFGWDAAANMACSGKLLNAQEARTLGAIDALDEDPEAFIQRCLTLPRPDAVSTRIVDAPTADWQETRRAALTRKARGQAAPLHNLDALFWAGQPYAEAQPRERALHLELRGSAESRALRHAFFAERRVSRPEVLANGAPSEIDRVAIVGGGLMGAGIAASCLMAGCSVTIIEKTTEAARSAEERVRGLLQGALDRGKITEAKHNAYLNRFAVATEDSVAEGVDLVIEAVFEDLAVKRDVFARMARVVPSETLLATNTSYLDPRAIFAGVPNPARCLGLHFFSPAHIMKLLEVVQGPETSTDVLASAFAFARRLRKLPVLAGICDGFIGNRILAASRRAAEYMLVDGALPQEIDAAMRDFGMAMGPFEAQDMAGLQIAEANRRRQDATRDPAERYVDISDQLCALDRYGQRCGKGWYRYDESGKAEVDPEVTTLIEDTSQRVGIKRRSFTPEEIVARLLAVQANEGARIVEEGIAESAAAIDVVLINGYGFPRWRGGPMWQATERGIAATRAALDALEADSPGSWVRAQIYC